MKTPTWSRRRSRPSHAAILTGLYPLENGLHNNGQGRLAADALANLLKDHGYATAAFISAIVLDKEVWAEQRV
ncbi:MAG: sulfatase-like hydrolase/transferase [Planctomycetaceae bacterium]